MKFPPRASEADAARLTAARKNNIRQLLLRASRVLNAEIVEELIRRGYTIRSTHTALLSNLDDEGNKLSVVAARAGMSKQALGRLADELEALGYLLSVSDDDDKRSRIIQFTAKGWALMIESFNALDAIERRYANRIGVERLDSLRSILQDLLSSSHTDSQPLNTQQLQQTAAKGTRTPAGASSAASTSAKARMPAFPTESDGASGDG